VEQNWNARPQDDLLQLPTCLVSPCSIIIVYWCHFDGFGGCFLIGKGNPQCGCYGQRNWN